MKLLLIWLAVVTASKIDLDEKIEDGNNHRLIPLKLLPFDFLQDERSEVGWAKDFGQPEKECRPGFCCRINTTCCGKYFCCGDDWKIMGWWCKVKNKDHKKELN